MAKDKTYTEEDAPASMVTRTLRSNSDIDLNNLSGKTRMQLIDTGELASTSFTMPANMPGRKLAEIKEAQKQRTEEAMEKYKKSKEEESPNPYNTGDFIEYKEASYEVLGTDAKKGVLIEKGDKQIWVHQSKVVKG